MGNVLKRHHISFQNAIAGLRWAVSTQPNFRVHLTLSAIAILLSWYVELSRVEWAIILFTIVLGLSAELINTSLEAMTDLITHEWRADAKIAKDVAAGMMLTVATGAVGVALFILAPKLIVRLGF